MSSISWYPPIDAATDLRPGHRALPGVFRSQGFTSSGLCRIRGVLYRAPMTEVLPATPDGIARAAALLRDGALVAFGTETVYGLGGDATNAEAVAAIFAAKQRPRFNPLICHYASAAQAFTD